MNLLIPNEQKQEQEPQKSTQDDNKYMNDVIDQEKLISTMSSNMESLGMKLCTPKEEWDVADPQK